MMMHIFKISTFTITLLIIIGCFFSAEEDTIDFQIQSSLMVGNQSLMFDTMNYVTPAGNPYTIEWLTYYLSNFTFYDEDGNILHYDESILYFDGKDEETLIQTLKDIPLKNFHHFSFTFGLDSAHNYDNSLPITNENLNMVWPQPWGGGYHHLKMEGRFAGTTDTIGYFLHIGSGKFDSLGTNQDRILFNHFEVSSGPLELKLKNNDILKAKITMDINNWFGSPNSLDLNLYNYDIMHTDTAQIFVKENGYNNVFDVGSFEINP